MTRNAVDVGIDLGTTNSCAAVMVQGQAQVVPNIEWESNLTPSYVAVNTRGELEVGSAAVNVLKNGDAVNVAEGFKRFIGQNHTWTFPTTGASYTPEQLSAIILQSIRRDIQTVDSFLNEDVDSAVITIPAVFGERERSATLSAAHEAGFVYAELVQEPIAAGLAYGWDKSDDERPFLVYDIGGGTFDAAIVQEVHGQLIVRAHRGEHALGGRDIDRAIWNQIVRPQLENRMNSAQLDEAEPKLLIVIEDAKKRLSRVPEASVALEGRVVDAAGRPIVDVLTLSRSDLTPLIDPVVDRTIMVVEEILAETSLTPTDLKGFVLVGGPTRMPRLRAALEEKFGDILQSRLDPMTVVAQGAALHAASVLKRHTRAASRSSGIQHLKIEYSPVTDQSTILVGIAGEGSRLVDGSSMRISRSDGLWHTGQIPIEENKVVTEVSMGDDRRSVFKIELLDSSGTPVSIEPDEFAVVSGLAAAAPPLSKNIGVSVATSNGPRFHPFARRGEPLPFTKRESFRTTRDVQAGAADVAVEVWFLEGDSEHPRRCGTLGVIELTGAMIERSLPVNSLVEVTLRITNSGSVRGTVHIPSLNRTLEDTFKIFTHDVATAVELRQRLAHEHEVAGRLIAAGADLPVTAASVESEIEDDLVRAENGDAEAAVRAGHALDRLGQAMEDVEREAEPKLAVSKMNETEEWVVKLVETYGDAEQHARLTALQDAGQAARDPQDPREARRVEESLMALGQAIYWGEIGAWMGAFQNLASGSKFVDPSAADDLIEVGHTALETGDEELLKRVVIDLFNLVENHEVESPEARLMWLRQG